MNRIFVLCLLLVLSLKASSQADTAAPHASIKTNYLKKSKTQKTVGWILLGTGTAMVVTGMLVAGNSVEAEPPSINPDDTVSGGILVASGLVVDLISIPFFISSSKNKRRAATVGLRSSSFPILTHAGLIQKSRPSLSFTLRF